MSSVRLSCTLPLARVLLNTPAPSRDLACRLKQRRLEEERATRETQLQYDLCQLTTLHLLTSVLRKLEEGRAIHEAQLHFALLPML